MVRLLLTQPPDTMHLCGIERRYGCSDRYLPNDGRTTMQKPPGALKHGERATLDRMQEEGNSGSAAGVDVVYEVEVMSCQP